MAGKIGSQDIWPKTLVLLIMIIIILLNAAGVLISSVVIDRCVWIAMLLWQQVNTVA